MSSSSEPRSFDFGEPLILARAMIGALPLRAVGELGRALHAKRNVPPTPAERRLKMLRPLARLLEERPQYPEYLPYIPRKEYDARRGEDPSLGPPSARLHERFGSWARACHAAWGLLDDGRSWGPGQPWPRPPRDPRNYAVTEAETSVRSCKEALGHVPSSDEYHHWVINRRARARAAGTSTRPYVPYHSLMRLLAADRAHGNGWRLVVQRVLTNSQITTDDRDSEPAETQANEEAR